MAQQKVTPTKGGHPLARPWFIGSYLIGAAMAFLASYLAVRWGWTLSLGDCTLHVTHGGALHCLPRSK